MPFPCGVHAMLLPCRSSQGLEKNGMVRAWHVHGMASVNQTRPHCVNQMEKTHSKSLAARQGNGMGAAWERHAMCESALTVEGPQFGPCLLRDIFKLGLYKIFSKLTQVSRRRTNGRNGAAKGVSQHAARFFYLCTEHRCYGGMYRRMQASTTIQLPCLVTR